MTITTLRDELRQVRAYVAEGERDKALDALDRALEDVQPDRLLTTSEAAEMLGIRSVNTVKALVRREGLAYERHGNRMMIPLRELERIQGSQTVRGIQASDRAHDDADWGGDDLTLEQMKELERARPGTVPHEPLPTPQQFYKNLVEREDIRAILKRLANN
jgi:excisionase family DNA binding protein